MPTIIATLGAADANSLLTVAAADAYFDLGLGGGAWAELDDEDKQRALVSATRNFQAITWQGSPTTGIQALAFPRYYQGASDGTTIPANVLAALCEHALDLALTNAAGTLVDGTSRQQMRAEGVTSYRLGDRSETFSALSASTLSDVVESFSGRVQRLLQGWIRRTGQIDSGRRPYYPGGNYDASGLWWPRELL